MRYWRHHVFEVIVGNECSSGHGKGKADVKLFGGTYQEHLIINGTIEEKERDDGKRNHNYAECHQFNTLIFTEHLLHSRSCPTPRVDPSNTQHNRTKNQVNTNVLPRTVVNYKHTPSISYIYEHIIFICFFLKGQKKAEKYS